MNNRDPKKMFFLKKTKIYKIGSTIRLSKKKRLDSLNKLLLIFSQIDLCINHKNINLVFYSKTHSKN